MQLKIQDSFDVEDGLKSAILGMKTPTTPTDPGQMSFEGVSDPNDFWKWMTTALVPSVYKSKMYNGETLNPYEKNYIASFNRVVGGMFMLQHRRKRSNADNTFSKFYPVKYLDDEDTEPFGPLYQECGATCTEDCADGVNSRVEDGTCLFYKNKALLENSGIEGITNICDTFENVPLREEFCDGACLVTNDGTRSWDASNKQCTQCRGMCVQHFEDEDLAGGSLTRICEACTDYFEADPDGDDDNGRYATLGPLHFTSKAAGTNSCEQYKSRCLARMCDGCIDTGPPPLVFNSPIVYDVASPKCYALLPMCDDYLYTELAVTCTPTVLPEIGGCAPATIGEGVCNSGCNSQTCEWDRGDCCAQNLDSRSMPPCAAAWNGTSGWTGAIGDSDCHPECWNEFCLQDGGDCVFCTEPCMLAANTSTCAVCLNDCRSPECEAVCPDHSACTGDCTACPLENTCIPQDMQQRGGTTAADLVGIVNDLPQCFPQKVGDGTCDFECFTGTCSFDAGDCGTCPPECVLRQGDGICDAECYDACPREIEDCPDCSDGCTPFEVGDGTCNPECFNPLCSFDSGDCYYCGSDCVGKMGDGHCDAECYIGACELDGGDCNVCNPDTGCLNSLVNNGICDKACYNFECDFDGQDCYHCDLRPECSDKFVGDGTCDYDCYHEDCAWDGGDCDTACMTSEYGICKTYMTLDDTCQRECYFEECGWDGDADDLGVGNTDADGNIQRWAPRSGEGPCEPECSKDCQLHQIGDRTCDRTCFTEACQYDAGDCDVCATGCPWSWVHDGQCDPECYVESCFFDSNDQDVQGAVGDCSADTQCATGCTPFMVGNSVCDANCTSASCGFDGGDCGQFCGKIAMLSRFVCCPSR